MQVQLEDTKKAREDAYERYVASRLDTAPVGGCHNARTAGISLPACQKSF